MTRNRPARHAGVMAAFGALFALAGCAPLPFHAAQNPVPKPSARSQSIAPPVSRPRTRCFVAETTTEGIACPAVRRPTGRLVTLVPQGVLGRTRPGERVCLCGRPVVGPSVCRQGVTLRVTHVSNPESCRELRDRFSGRR